VLGYSLRSGALACTFHRTDATTLRAKCGALGHAGVVSLRLTRAGKTAATAKGKLVRERATLYLVGKGTLAAGRDQVTQTLTTSTGKASSRTVSVRIAGRGSGGL
jgi:hypothetical protein